MLLSQLDERLQYSMVKLPFTVCATRDQKSSVLLPQNCGQDTRKVGLVLGKEGVTLMRDEQIIASLVEDWQE
ncbi:Conserved_hypothetical protein [Hexamita inflata]|uniref:Uncharacterized protein n=1 Tax=Hexamita inflata TaxID=28002 RepID=A0AA86N5F9_9EUKA|nr:Conserved hypothetical protein [Hexamita inflata]